MKIALTSDLHIFLTKEKSVVEMFKNLALEKPDVIVIAGDHSGSAYGYKGSRAVFKIARESFDGPILACLGNHDYWVQGRKRKDNDLNFVGISTPRFHHPSLESWTRNYATIVAAAKEHRIHLFEEDGIYRFPGMWGFTFAGHGLWYAMPPNSHDSLYMPIGLEGDTHRSMYKRTTEVATKQLEQLNDKEDGIRIYVSHFPIVELNDSDLPWSGDPFFGEMLRTQYQFTTFLNGHSHGDKNGPLR